MLQLPAVRNIWNLHSLHGLATLNAEITRQAEMIAYNNVFKLLMVLTLAIIPLILMLRNQGSAGGETPAAALD